MNTDQLINSFLKSHVYPSLREIIREELQKNEQHSNFSSGDEYLTAKESAEFLGDALQTFYGRTSRGEINTYGSGKRIFCKRSELAAWKEKQRTKTKDAEREEIRADIRKRKWSR
ncbi:helix-turn-helix domain-containing protein [Catalinimonas sp. 4WD22]|uniref:helix-turn-helix domain-containing protein n=1 Tax=Catalinimonas locisalis TaxID=3133978 RepID=UPI003100E158